jgi:F0F1-type ATP synthase beta subunit
MTVMSAGRELATPVSREAFDRIVRLLASSSLAPGTLVPTGIKVIGVMCSLVAGGTLAIAGEWKAGTAVLLEELVRRLSGGTDRVSIFTFVPGGGTMTYAAMMAKEGYSDGTVGAVQTFFFRREDGPWTPETLSALTGFDVVIRLSEALGRLGIYPSVDPLTSRSRLIESSTLGQEHVEVAARAREALTLLAPGAPAHHPLAVARARKLSRFFAQPFFCAEPYTRRPGVTVSMTAWWQAVDFIERLMTLCDPLAWLAPLVVPQLEAENMELDRCCALPVPGHGFHHELFVSDDGSTRGADFSRRGAPRHFRGAVIR